MSWNLSRFLRNSRQAARRPSQYRTRLGVEQLETRLAPSSVPMGANIDQVLDYSRSDVFVDMMKQSRPFTSLATGQPAAVGANGYPTQDFEALVQTGFTGAGSLYDGVYKLSFTGQATVDTASTPGGAVSNVVYNAATNTTTADVTLNAPDSNSGWYFILHFHNVSGIGNIHLIRPGYDPSGSQIFTNNFLAQLQPFSTIRFMDFERTNGNAVVNWSDRAQVTDPSQATAKGVAWEYVVDLANVTHKDIWINIPVGATDDYVKQLATLLKGSLSSGIHVYVEYSNEVWNTSFSQTFTNLNAAVAEVQAGLNSGTPSNLMYSGETAKNPDGTFVHQWDWANRRVARTIMQISNDFASVWGSAAIDNQIRPVLASQMANPWLVETGLEYLEKTFGAPKQFLYAIAGAPYFNLNGQDSNTNLTTDQVLAALSASIDSVQTQFQAYAHWGTYYGLNDLAYEGGPDTFGPNNIAAKKAASLDPRMEGLVVKYLDDWFSQGGGLFMWYFAGPSSYDTQYGTWGLTNDIRNLSTPKILGIQDVENAAAPANILGTPVPGSVAATSYLGSNVAGQSYLPQQGNGTTLDYLVQAPQAGTYNLTLTYAANNPGEQVQVIVNDLVVQTLTLAVTGPDHDSQWAPTDFANAPAVTLNLNQGLNVVRLLVVNNGYSLQTLTFSAVSTNPPPTIAAPASAAGQAATMVNLAVLGADSSGESTLTYTWSVTSAPANAPAASFSANGTNAAKNSTVTFGAAGTYSFLVTIRDAVGLTTTSTVSVTVAPVLTSVAVSPASALVANGATLQLSATGHDQFGNTLIVQPAFTWSASSGTVSSTGLYTAPASGTSATVTATSGSLSASAAITLQQGLTSSWVDADVGGPALTGSASGSSTITVSGSGYDIWGEADQFNFASQTLTGDGTIVAHVASQQNTDPWAKAGVMVRETTAAGATFADVVLTPGNGAHFQYRTSTSGSAADVAGPSIAASSWVKLVRSGTTLTGYVSTDGVSWTLVGSTSISMAATVQVGLAVTAHNNTLLGTAVFDHVSITTPPVNLPPTVATAAHVVSSTPTTVTLNVIGADDGGASNLTYTWTATGAAAVTFSANGTNAAQSVTATFAQAGSYTFHVTIKDAGGLSTSASDPGTIVTVVVNQVLTSLAVTPATVSLVPGGTQQFSAAGKDQFGGSMTPAVTWTVTGGGSVSSTGLYTSPASGPSTATVTATSGSVTASATVTVTAPSSGIPNYANGFTSSGLLLNGGATLSGTRLRLTNGGTFLATSAYYATPVSVNRFTTSFDFQLTNPNADGFTFVLQNSGPTARGSVGGGLGYLGMTKSVAIKFDLYNNAGEGNNSTGLLVGGSDPTSASTSINLTGTGINLHSGDVFHVTMTYDGKTLNVTITDTKTGASATQRYTVNIPQAVGGSTAYVGFTAGTGGLTATQDILDWTYQPM
jgi:hypothetical protein